MHDDMPPTSPLRKGPPLTAEEKDEIYAALDDTQRRAVDMVLACRRAEAAAPDKTAKAVDAAMVAGVDAPTLSRLMRVNRTRVYQIRRRAQRLGSN